MHAVTARTRCGWFKVTEHGKLPHRTGFPLKLNWFSKSNLRPAILGRSEVWCMR